MRTQTSTIWMENEIEANRKMANVMGYCLEAYLQKIREEEEIERELTNLPIKMEKKGFGGVARRELTTTEKMCKRMYYQRKNEEKAAAEKWRKIQEGF